MLVVCIIDAECLIPVYIKHINRYQQVHLAEVNAI